MTRGARAVAILLAGAVAGALAGGVTPVAAQTAEDPSDVVLVFDVSNSILLSEDGTNTEFAAALEGIADRVEESAADLAVGNAKISFVVFGRQAIIYPNGCDQLALHENPAAIAQLEGCLRTIAAEYAAGADAPVRQRVNTTDTDHVAALRRAADLLPDETTRSAVIFFTDGRHDPPGIDRDDEDVVAQIAAAYEGQSPLAILPVGLGAGAGAFETELRAIYDAYFRDMEPCEGRAEFAWPEVVFEAPEDAGIAVAQALQEVTCSFTFVPTPTGEPSPTPAPTVAPTPGPPLGLQVLAGNASLTVQWQAPTSEAERITGYLVRCTSVAGGDVHERQVADAATQHVVVDGLEPGVAYTCEVAATDGVTPGPFTAATAPTVVLGIPGAPAQPKAEPLDGAARLSVDPVAGGIPVESYIYDCSDATGGVVTAAGSNPVTVAGLVNGVSYTCVGYAENRIGRSAASVASAPFSPCSGLFQCQPWTPFALGAFVLAGLGAAAWVVLHTYRRRNRAWITAQVDGGANLPLGWGPELGVHLDQGDAGWFAAARPAEQSRIRVRYKGANRFDVLSGTSTTDVHQGDPVNVRDEAGARHTLILRRYRGKPRERPAAPPAPRGVAPPDELGERLEGRENEPPSNPGGMVG